MKRTTIIGTAIAALGLAACGSTVTPSAIPTPATTGAAVQLSLVGENGSIAATVEDPGGVDGHAYYVGSDDVYFLDGTTVKAFGRNGTVSTVGQVPQVK